MPGITGEIARITDQAGNTLFTKAYDPAGRLIGVKAGSFKTGISYDGFGRRAKLAHSDGSTQNIRYDLLNRVKSLSWRTKAGPIEEHLNYDASGNIFELSRENARYDMQYDAVNQLTAVKSAALGSEPNVHSLEYDLLGNRQRDSKRGKGEFVSNFLVQDAISKFQADVDGFGEVAHEKTGQEYKSFTYRPDGRISSFQSGDTTVSSYYDALGRLVARVTNKGGVVSKESFVHLAEENRYLLGKAASGDVTTQIDGQGANDRLSEVGVGGGKGYITDFMGSVLNSHIVGNNRSYGIFGEILGASPGISPSANPVNYGWQGMAYDAHTGNWDNYARQYSSTTGAFLTQDPSGIEGGLNLYRSRRNNPLKYADFNGLDVTIVYYAGEEGHIGLSVNDGPSRGFYPDPTLKNLLQGKLKKDARVQSKDQVVKKLRLKTTAEQDQAVNGYLDQLEKKGANFTYFTNVCTTEAGKALWDWPVFVDG